ncbi:unnamed protein product [Lasius platythorax]|uniref:Caspase-1 n=1 Tax=Lasius platythorax TaxID=488582 RepID=A0AAV2NY36_9HYME
MSSTEPENNINNGNNVGDALRLLEISRDNMTSGAASLQTSSTEYYSTHYKMNHSKCGIALILNHEFFTTPSLRTRTGTNVDCDSLINTLTSLNFEVKDMHNSIYSDIVRMLEKIANMDHSEHDCLIVAVLSHGILDYLYAYDTFYKAESLWCHFTPDKCPTLAGKPKLFFIQACQGKKLDPGIILLERTTTDGLPNATFQLQADFLIAYSTIPGYYSWRNTEHGSWFIEALCTELRENGTRYDLLTLLTFVCQRVAIDFESCTSNPIRNGKKQTPCIISMLTRLVRFTKTTFTNDHSV